MTGQVLGRSPLKALSRVAAERRQARAALGRARHLAEEVRDELAAVRDALLRLQEGTAAAEEVSLRQVGPLYPPPADHAVKEEAEALRLCADILSGRLTKADDDLSMAG